MCPPNICSTSAAAALLQIDFSRVVMNGMLGFLLFAGALHVDLGKLRSRAMPVAILAFFGTVVSTAIVGGGFWVVGAAGRASDELGWALVFGALISPTDPGRGDEHAEERQRARRISKSRCRASRCSTTASASCCSRSCCASRPAAASTGAVGDLGTAAARGRRRHAARARDRLPRLLGNAADRRLSDRGADLAGAGDRHICAGAKAARQRSAFGGGGGAADRRPRRRATP